MQFATKDRNNTLFHNIRIYFNYYNKGFVNFHNSYFVILCDVLNISKGLDMKISRHSSMCGTGMRRELCMHTY